MFVDRGTDGSLQDFYRETRDIVDSPNLLGSGGRRGATEARGEQKESCNNSHANVVGSRDFKCQDKNSIKSDYPESAVLDRVARLRPCASLSYGRLRGGGGVGASDNGIRSNVLNKGARSMTALAADFKTFPRLWVTEATSARIPRRRSFVAR